MVEVCEAAVPNLHHPGLFEPQVTLNSVLDTSHHTKFLSSEQLSLELDSSRSMMASRQSIYPRLALFNCIFLETLKILRLIKFIVAYICVQVKFTGMIGDNDDGGHD